MGKSLSGVGKTYGVFHVVLFTPLGYVHLVIGYSYGFFRVSFPTPYSYAEGKGNTLEGTFYPLHSFNSSFLCPSRESKEDLVPAEPNSNVTPSDVSKGGDSKGLEEFVSSMVSFFIIDSFETINVYHDKSNSPFNAFLPFYLSGKPFLKEVRPGVKPGEVVPDREAFEGPYNATDTKEKKGKPGKERKSCWKRSNKNSKGNDGKTPIENKVPASLSDEKACCKVTVKSNNKESNEECSS